MKLLALLLLWSIVQLSNQMVWRKRQLSWGIVIAYSKKRKHAPLNFMTHKTPTASWICSSPKIAQLTIMICIGDRVRCHRRRRRRRIMRGISTKWSTNPPSSQWTNSRPKLLMCSPALKTRSSSSTATAWIKTGSRNFLQLMIMLWMPARTSTTPRSWWARPTPSESMGRARIPSRWRSRRSTRGRSSWTAN